MGNRTSTRKDTSSSAGSGPAKGRGGRFGHYALLLGLCLGLALAIVFVITRANPPDDAVVSPAGETPDPTPTVVLPTIAEEVSNEQLQKEAVAEVEALVKRFPKVAGALHVEAMLLVGLQQTEKAEQVWRECIAIDPRYVGPRVGLANALAERGQNEAAVEVLNTAFADGCSSPEAYHLLAATLAKLGRLKESEEALKKGVAQYAGDAELWLLLGQTQNQLQRFPEAEASLLKAVGLGCESPAVYFALSTASTRQGKTKEAAEHRKRFSEMKAGEAKATGDRPFYERYGGALRAIVVTALGGAAAVYARQGDAAEAERLFLRGLALVPGHSQILGELGALYLQAGRIADARAVQERLVAMEPKNVFHHVNLASVAAQVGDFERAESALNEAVRLQPQFGLPYISLAQLHLQMGDLQQARSFAETGVRLAPSAHGYGVLAFACQAVGDTKAAEAARAAAEKLAGEGAPQ